MSLINVITHFLLPIPNQLDGHGYTEILIGINILFLSMNGM